MTTARLPGTPARLKVATIVGTRPELIRLSRVIAALDRELDHVLIHTGQNYDYELNQVFFDELRIRKPDVFLNAAGETAAITIGQVIIKADEVLEQAKPDAVLILGDTNSSLAAIVAKRRHIPIFHMEAGNRGFDERVPEEINRRMIDHISDINLPYSQIAREHLLREGLAPDRVIKTGSPMREVLDFYADEIREARALEKMALEKGEYFLVSVHREENVDGDITLGKLLDVLDAVAERYDLPIVFSVHPRTRKRLDQLGRQLHPRVRTMKPFGFFDYVRLQQDARAVLSDSGTITEESSVLGFDALNLRQTHERPEGMEEAAVMMVGLEAERVLQGLSILEGGRGLEARAVMRDVADYAATNVSEKVLRIILSYTDYVRRTVWRVPGA